MGAALTKAALAGMEKDEDRRGDFVELDIGAIGKVMPTLRIDGP